MMPLRGSRRFMETKSLQRQVHKILAQCAFGNLEGPCLSSLVLTRISKLFAPFLISDVDIHNAFALLQTLPPVPALKVIKTWLNGWATSRRMKEDVTLPCLLGCDGGEDSLNHYVQCPHLFAFCKYLFNSDACPLIRLGIKCPTTLNLKIVSCVFSAYHALKAQVRDGRISMHENTRTIRISWSVFADALAAEAGECHISFVAFSLPKFVSFLTNQNDP